MTGFLGEIFGAVQAVKVAGAEEHVVAHFARLERGAPARPRCADRVFDQLLHSVVVERGQPRDRR